MTTTPAQDDSSLVVNRIRASGPSEILQAVPYVIGFHPQQSLVLLGLTPPRGRLRVSARLDLDVPVKVAADLASPWFDGAVRSGVDRYVVVIYDDAIDGKPLPYGELVDALEVLGDEAALSFVDALAVGDGRWWSYKCSNQRCCPDEGQPLDAHGPIAAQAVTLGMVAAPGREALTAELEPEDERVDEVVQALAAMSGRQIETAAGKRMPLNRRQLVTAIKHLEWLLERFQLTQTPCEPHQAVRALLALTNLVVRDAMIATIPLKDDLLPLMFWRDLCRRAPDELVAAPATLFALCAYGRGEGARANIGIERALEADPEYRMAHLLDSAMAGGLAPHLFIPDIVEGARVERDGLVRKPRRKSA
ncbi:MAG TPA: DUF4192 domain-containing protein [Actinomycetes bacterium]|nr:DUF4192 domain-containing protein [Actinomycetes bacterium]